MLWAMNMRLQYEYASLMTRRSSSVLGYSTVWGKVLRLFSYTTIVSNSNESKLLSLHVPIARIGAESSSPTAKSQPSDQAQGLEEFIRLATSACVMLRANLWTTKGIVNGAVGTVLDVYYVPGKTPAHDMPLAVLINFDGYPGPCWPRSCVWPIPPVIHSFVFKNVSYTQDLVSTGFSLGDYDP